MEKTKNLITERKGVKGTSYLVRIRQNGVNHNETFKTKKEAEKFVLSIKSKLINNQAIDNLKIKKNTLEEIFLEYIKENKLSVNKVYALHNVIADIGKLKLEDLKSSRLGNYIKLKLDEEIPDQEKKKKDHPLYNANKILVDGELVRRKYSEGTVRKYYYCIKTALQWHSKYYDYPFDKKPFDDNPPPKAWANPRTRILEDGELEKLLIACNSLYVKNEEIKAFLKFQYYSAMRCNESLLMRWDDIYIDKENPKNSFIIVPKKNQKTANKESSFDRKIPLRPDFYYFVINELFKIKKDNQILVFGDYWSNSGRVARQLKILTKNANIKDLKIHDFRHSAVTWYFINTTLSQIEISMITGHTELDTLKRYLTLRPSDINSKLWN